MADIMKITRCIVAVMLCLCGHAALADVDGLLLKIAEAYGGQERIAEVNAWQQTGTTFSVLRGEEGRIVRSFQYPDHLRVEIRYDQDAEIRILAGPSAWKQGKPAEGIFYSAMLLQAARLGLPSILFEHRQLVRDAGVMVGRKGHELQALELDFHGNYRIQVGIDPATGRILESRGIISGNGSAMEFGTAYDDFRLQDGRLFAFRETHYAMGRETGYTTIQNIEIRSELPHELFNPDGQEIETPENTMAMR